MLKKFITKSVRSLGMFFIFIFAIFCIFGTLLVRDVGHNNALFSKFLDFTVSFENRFYDFRMRSQLDPTFISKEVILVKIDDYSLQKIGVWPIPRTNYAKMLEKLNEFGTKVVAMDIMFPERSPLMGDTSPDTILADAIKKYQTEGGRVFIGYTVNNGQEEENFVEAPVNMLNDAVMTRNAPESDMASMKIGRYAFPIEELVNSEVGLGYISAAEDRDGIFRHYQLVANVDTIYYGSLAFNAFEAYIENKNTISISSDNTGELQIDDKKLELSSKGETKIRYIGGDGNFETVSLYDLIVAKSGDQKMKELLTNKIAFIGSTAAGAHDLRPSPVDSKMPGVYAHMNMAHMLLHKYFYKNINESIKYSLFILILGMLIFLFVQRFGNPFLDAVMLIFILVGTYYTDQVYFIPEGYELKLFYCYFCFVSCYSWNTFIKFYESNKEKKQIRGTFARYVAPTIVDEMLKDPDKLHVGGSKMDITCLFSDVRDFTSISENLSATELAHSLNKYMGAMTDIVFDTKGTLDKYIGDAIVALWGAPLPIGNHAQFAVEGAIRMMEILPSINEEFKKLGRPVFKIGIGLNSGECSVGNMGSERIFSYTALGDNMNLGARLESLCKHYGGDILISDMTLERLDLTNIKTRPIDKVIVKGKSTPVGVHEVLHPHHWMTKDPETLSFYHTAYQLFQNKNFATALDIFNQLAMANEEDKPSKRLRNICKKYVESPELANENFDITTMTEK